MSYTSIPNQPIIFNELLPEGCKGCDSDYAQLFDYNDQLFFQLEVDTCTDMSFNSVLYAVDASLVGSTVTFPSTMNAISGIGLLYNKFILSFWYKLVITVDEASNGTLIIGVTNGSSAQVSIPGTHTIYLLANNVPANTNSPTQNLLFSANSATATKFVGSFTIDSFKPVPSYQTFVGLVDAVTLSPIMPFAPLGVANNNTVTNAIALKDYEIEPGCYRLGLADFCTNTCGQYYIYNPYFNSGVRIPTGWTSIPQTGSDNWVVGGGSAFLSYTNTNNMSYLESVTELCEGKEYSVTIVIDSIVDGSLRVCVDNIPEGTLMTTAGTFTFNITPASSGNLSLLLLNDIGQRAEIYVTQIQVSAYKEWATYDKYSEPITIGNYSDECRFFKLEGCNAENQFGFFFGGSSFLPGIRLEGRKFRAQYNSDVDLFRYASGKAVTSYADIRKRWSFYFGQLPEYVFDFLSIVTYFDNFYINGELYSPAETDFPDIEYNDANDLGNITIDLFKKDVKVRKTVCVAADANCLPSILDLGSEPFILTQDDNRIVTQDNINLYQE